MTPIEVVPLITRSSQLLFSEKTPLVAAQLREVLVAAQRTSSRDSEPSSLPEELEASLD